MFKKEGLALKTPESIIVCRCEGVTWQDVLDAVVRYEPTSLRQLKLVTRWGMGMCQGRVCRPITAVSLIPEAESPSFRLAVRPPFKPINLGVFSEEDES